MKKQGGGRDNKFNNCKSVLNEIISNVLVQVQSYPEKFSYEQLCEELLKQKPIQNTDKQVEGEVKQPEKRKKAPFLKNGVKLVSKHNKGQGNIPNEFKRRKKPSRMTLLNRVRQGLPVNSDDEDDNFDFMRKKQKTGEEKKQKVLEVIQRLSRERTEQVAKQVITIQETIVTRVEINDSDTRHTKPNQSNSSDNPKEYSSNSSDDSADDCRDQRKSEAQKLSSNFSNDLVKYVNKGSQETKDLNLSDLINIIKARSAPYNNAEESSSKIDERSVVDHLQNLSLNDSDTNTDKVPNECEIKQGGKPSEENNDKPSGVETSEKEDIKNIEEESVDINQRETHFVKNLVGTDLEVTKKASGEISSSENMEFGKKI